MEKSFLPRRANWKHGHSQSACLSPTLFSTQVLGDWIQSVLLKMGHRGHEQFSKSKSCKMQCSRLTLNGMCVLVTRLCKYCRSSKHGRSLHMIHDSVYDHLVYIIIDCMRRCGHSFFRSLQPAQWDYRLDAAWSHNPCDLGGFFEHDP